MKKLLKYIGLLILPFGLMVSCEDEADYPDTTQYETVITGIKIINGGASGTETIVGTVDENKKQISFPEVALESDLSHVEFEIETTDSRAHLDSAQYDFVVPEGATQRVRTIRLVNSTRYRDYYVTIRLDVPVWGADFTKAVIYDFSNVTSNIYAGLATQNIGRQATIGLNNVFVAGRTKSVLLNMDALKQGKIEETELNLTGVSGGNFAVNGGYMTRGHIYAANMNLNVETGPINIYHWEEAHPEAVPTRIASYKSDVITGATGRFEGFLSVDLDESGNGYIFVYRNSGSGAPAMVRFSVSGFTTVSDPKFIMTVAAANGPGSWAGYNRVEGENLYVSSGWTGPIMFANADGEVSYTIPTEKIAAINGVDAYVINFNKERYLAMMSTGEGNITVYDITQGATLTEALDLLNVDAPLIKYSLKGSIANANASISLSWVADGSDKLYILGGAPAAGFAIIEVPKKVKETTTNE